MERTPTEHPDREPLPLDASALPPLNPQAAAALTEGLRAMRLDLPAAVLATIDIQARLLAAWGQHINLTAIRDPVEVVRLHVLDSLSAIGPIRARLGSVGSLVDIGSGGGYPGIPLGVALAVERVSLVESVGRKARFLGVTGSAVMDALGDTGSPAIEVLPVRAETLAAGERRATWDVATVRAVGSVIECAELALPLLRTGGLLVCWKRDRGPLEEGLPGPSELRQEVDAARALIGSLGGEAPEVVPAGVPGLPDHHLVLVRKVRPTPASFPRPPAIRRASAARGPRRRA